MVNVGFLAPPDVSGDAWEYDAPRFWAKNKLGIPRVVEYRSSLVNSRVRANVKQVSRVLEIAKEIGV